jgi:hypothetical protein
MSIEERKEERATESRRSVSYCSKRQGGARKSRKFNPAIHNPYSTKIWVVQCIYYSQYSSIKAQKSGFPDTFDELRLHRIGKEL